MRSLLALPLVLPMAAFAGDPAAVAPSCLKPAALKDFRVQGVEPYQVQIITKRGADDTELRRRFGVMGDVLGAAGIEGFVVRSLTPREIAEVRCEGIVERVVLVTLHSGP